VSELLAKLSAVFLLPPDDLLYLIRSAPYRYKVYQVPKKEPGETRTIAQPAPEVKNLQYWVMENFLSRFPIHAAATAYRKGRNIASNAQPHARNRYLCKMDFRNFFPSIKSTDFERFLSANASAAGWTEEEVGYLSRILFRRERRGGDLRLSIGAPSSPLLSNILLYRFDVAVSDLCSGNGVSYTRYADDLTFSTNRQKVLYQIEHEIPHICTRLESPKLFLNRKKTVHASKKEARRVTGLVLTNEGLLSIGREKKRQLRATLHRFVSGKLDAEETAKLAGMVSFIKSVEPEFLQRVARKYGQVALTRLLSNTGPPQG
jgi:RNA-directed DNA polymerase